MRRAWVWAAAAAGLVAAQPAAAAVDLLQRLVDKGILTEEERKELAREEDVASSHKGKSFAWASRDGRFGAELYGYNQVRYTFEDRDADNSSAFDIARARAGVRGHALTRDLRYTLFLDVYSSTTADAKTVLEEYSVDYTPLKALGLRAGQFKVPHGYQWLVSASAQQFVDRTAVDGNFRFDYDTGLDLHGALGPAVSYDLGVWNGEGKNRRNSDDKHLYVARVTVEPLAKYGSESDHARTKTPALLLAGGVAYDDDVATHTRGNLNGRLAAAQLGASDVLSMNGTLGLKWAGASLQSEYHRRRIMPNNGAKDDETATGFYAQAGCFVWADRLEVAARYEVFDPDNQKTDDLSQEYGLGVNWFFAAHRNKLQADFFRTNKQDPKKSSVDDGRLRVQYTLAF